MIDLQLIATGNTGALLQVAGLSFPCMYIVSKMCKVVSAPPKKKKVKRKPKPVKPPVRKAPAFITIEEPVIKRKSAFVTAE